MRGEENLAPGSDRDPIQQSLEALPISGPETYEGNGQKSTLALKRVTRVFVHETQILWETFGIENDSNSSKNILGTIFTPSCIMSTG